MYRITRGVRIQWKKTCSAGYAPNAGTMFRPRKQNARSAPKGRNKPRRPRQRPRRCLLRRKCSPTPGRSSKRPNMPRRRNNMRLRSSSTFRRHRRLRNTLRRLRPLLRSTRSTLHLHSRHNSRSIRRIMRNSLRPPGRRLPRKPDARCGSWSSAPRWPSCW
jgi:hypothetical protein